jgi:hypothetical protein
MPEGNSSSFTYDDPTCATRCNHNVKTRGGKKSAALCGASQAAAAFRDGQ